MKKQCPILTICLTLTTLILSCLAAIKPAWYDCLSTWSSPEHIWQYASGIFVHGTEPLTFFAIHLGLNLLGLIPFGILLERDRGTKICAILFLCQWIITGILAQCLHAGDHVRVVGISTIVYAYAVFAIPSVLRRIQARKPAVKITRQPLFYYACFEYLGLLSMLNPLNGMTSLLLHTSGLVTGTIALWLCRRKTT